MKLSIVLTWANLLACVVAFRARGAAERAYFYSVYLMEELGYLDAEKFTIATGCVGTRLGLRGQPGRCRLSELMDFLWSPESGKDSSSKPDPDLVVWGKTYDEDFSKAEMTTMYSWIQQVQKTKIRGSDGKIVLTIPGKDYSAKLVPLPDAGYTGYVATQKLFPGVADYYEGIAKAGESAWKAKEAYIADTSIDPQDRLKWDIWKGRCLDGAAMVANYRILDAGVFKKTFLATYLKTKFEKSAMIKTDPVTLFGGEGARVAGAVDLNIAATITEWVTKTGLDEKTIADAIDEALLKLENANGAEVHNKALEGSKRSFRMASTGSFC